MPEVLISATNLHDGGGVQVAATFINDLCSHDFPTSPTWVRSAKLEVSTEVWRNLSDSAKARAIVADKSRSLGWAFSIRRTREYDAAFYVFGPTYEKPRAKIELIGLADPRLPGLGAARGPLGRTVLRLKRARVKQFHQVVVETEAYARALERSGLISGQVYVVPNVVEPSFLEEANGPELALEAQPAGTVLFAYPARPYPHKNHEYLGQVADELRARGHDVRFVVTLTRDELASFDEATQRACLPVGVLSVQECRSLYARVEGVFFPSLLEVFSVTPLEAFATGVPLVASDREFITSLTGRDGALLFEPTDPSDGARAIETLLGDATVREALRRRGKEIVSRWPTARDRSMSYVGLIDELLNSLCETRGTR